MKGHGWTLSVFAKGNCRPIGSCHKHKYQQVGMFCCFLKCLQHVFYIAPSRHILLQFPSYRLLKFLTEFRVFLSKIPGAFSFN